MNQHKINFSFLNAVRRSLTGNENSVFQEIYFLRGQNDGKPVELSASAIANNLKGISLSTVKRCIASLEANGFITNLNKGKKIKNRKESETSLWAIDEERIQTLLRAQNDTRWCQNEPTWCQNEPTWCQNDTGRWCQNETEIISLKERLFECQNDTTSTYTSMPSQVNAYATCSAGVEEEKTNSLQSSLGKSAAVPSTASMAKPGMGNPYPFKGCSTATADVYPQKTFGGSPTPPIALTPPPQDEATPEQRKQKQGEMKAFEAQRNEMFKDAMMNAFRVQNCETGADLKSLIDDELIGLEEIGGYYRKLNLAEQLDFDTLTKDHYHEHLVLPQYI